MKGQEKYVLVYKNSGEVLSKLKSREFRATSLSTYDFSTLYTTLSHNLVKEKLLCLIERTFKREETLYLAFTDTRAFLLLQTIDGINFLTHLDLYQSLYDFIAEARNYIMDFWFLLPVYSGSLKRIDYPKKICQAHPLSFKCFHCS